MSLTTCSDSPYRILVVDDEAAHRALEKEVLDAPHYRISEAGNGEEALEQLRRQEFDVVLLDKRMPGMDGDELCRRIRTELGLTLLPVIMVTGNSGREELLKSLHAGANDFVRKPYSPLELVARTESFAAHKRLTDQLDSAESLLFALARMVEARDENTGDHCARVAHCATVLGIAVGVGAEELTALRRGGVLHDIGKLGIPDSILLKKSALSKAEWSLMRQHTVIGAELLSGLRSMRLTAPFVRHHHERWDGTGYPDGLRGEAIPLLARIFQLADIFDALAFCRPYKPAFDLERIITIFEEEIANGWRDPNLTRVFLDILRHRPNDLLSIPENTLNDHGARIFQRIRETGAVADYMAFAGVERSPGGDI